MSISSKDRKAIISAFRTQQSRLLADLRAEVGASVTDLRLLGSVLDERRFRRGSDVDVAVLVTEGRAARVNRALYGEGRQLVLYIHGEELALDPITLTEAEWPRWREGRP